MKLQKSRTTGQCFGPPSMLFIKNFAKSVKFCWHPVPRSSSTMVANHLFNFATCCIIMVEWLVRMSCVLIVLFISILSKMTVTGHSILDEVVLCSFQENLQVIHILQLVLVFKSKRQLVYRIDLPAFNGEPSTSNFIGCCWGCWYLELFMPPMLISFDCTIGLLRLDSLDSPLTFTH
jgi:hypothetical protein